MVKKRFSAAFLFFALLLFPLISSAEKPGQKWLDSFTLEAKGKYEEAAELLKPEIFNKYATELALLRFGWLTYLDEEYNDSIKAYSRAIKKNPISLEAKLGISLPLLAQHRWREARKHLNQVLEESPLNYTANVRLMICEEGLHNWKDLERHAHKISSYYPSDATILVYLARAYAWQNKKPQAIATYQQVLIRDTGNVEASSYLTKHRSLNQNRN